MLKFQKVFRENNRNYLIIVKCRYSNPFNNQDADFAITGEIWRANVKGGKVGGDCESCGCIHEDIAKHFPEIAHLIKWHLVGPNGPMHFIANTTYHTSARDCWGKLKGEVKQTATRIKFGTNPIEHGCKKDFVAMLENYDKAGHLDRLEIVEVPHVNRDGDTYKFAPHYSFSDYEKKEWHEAPFKTRPEAESFLYALNHCEPFFITVPIAWGEGKEPDLDAARRCAIAPDATLDQLSDKEWLADHWAKIRPDFVADLLTIGLKVD